MTGPIFRHRRSGVFLTGILLFSLLIKIALAVSAEPLLPRGDENDYLYHAGKILDTHTYPGAFRPPLYPAFLASIFALGGTTRAVRIVQSIISTLSVWLIFLIGKRNLSHNAGLTAAALFAFDPILIGFSHLLWTETIFIFFLLLIMFLLVKPEPENRVLPWFTAGVISGAAALTRSQMLIYIPGILLWRHFHNKRSRTGEHHRSTGSSVPVMFLLGAILVISPWTIRNIKTTGAFVLIDNTAPFNLMIATHPDAWFKAKDDYWDSRWTRINNIRYPVAARIDQKAVNRIALKKCYRRIKRHLPGFFAKSIWEAAHLWTLDSFVLRHLRKGWYGPLPAWVNPTATILLCGFTAFLFITGLTGLVIARNTPLIQWNRMLVILSTILFSLLFALSRYNVSLHPILILSASAWITQRKTTPAATPGRKLIAGCLAGLLILAWIVQDGSVLVKSATAHPVKHSFPGIRNRFNP